MCGAAVYQYEHFDPVFAEACEHSADGITLLCGSHHDEKTRGLISIDTIRHAAAKPRALSDGFAKGSFYLEGPPKVTLASWTFINTQSIVRAFDTDILAVKPPEFDGGPFRISGIFEDRAQNRLLEIIENEWRGDSKIYDITTEANKICIRRKPREIALLLEVHPPRAIIVARFEMFFRGAHIEGNQTRLTVRTPGGQEFQSQGGGEVDTAMIGFAIGPNEIGVGTCARGVYLEKAVAIPERRGAGRPNPAAANDP